MKLLVTNDDGVASPGLHALVRELVEASYEVLVVAPSTDMSGAGASIGKLHVDQHIDAKPVDLPGLDGIPAFAVDGPPGLCVLAARLGGFGASPDLVVSGINPGCNTGRAVLHSGTVGAALTGANFGLSGLAVSIDAGPVVGNGERDQHWRSAAILGAGAVPWLEESPRATVININVPNLPLDKIEGARWAELASFGTVRSAVVEAPVEGGRLQMELRPTDEPLPPDTDTALIQAGFATLTKLTGIQATEPVDVDEILGTVLDQQRQRRVT
jgi:5'-nucleotidase